MAYTNVAIDTTKPSDTDLASGGDDEIRNLKRDLKERLETFFEDIDAEPLITISDLKEVVVGLAGARPADPANTSVKFYYGVDNKVLSINNGVDWVTYDLSKIGQGTTGTTIVTIENVLFSQLKGLQLTHSSMNIAVGAGATVETNVIFGGGAGLDWNNHIMLSFRWQIRVNGEVWPEKWAYIGTGQGATMNGTNADTVLTVECNAQLVQIIHADNPPFGVEHFVKVYYGLHSVAGAVNVDIRGQAFFLALA